MKKPFSTLAVVGAWSGVLLEEKGFGRIHEVFDHLYPGIMTLGLVAMADSTTSYLAKTIPGLLDLPSINRENYQSISGLAFAKFAPTIMVEGPIDADFNGLKTELDTLANKRPDMPVIVVSSKERESDA